MEEQGMWISRAGLLGVLSLATVSAACGTGRAAPHSPAPQSSGTHTESARRDTRVEIDNQNFSDMNIYLVNRGMRMFLGLAPGLSKSKLSIPRDALGSTFEVRLVADPIGGAPRIATPALTVAPDQSVYWTIGADAASSFASAG
jgi:hypothetical protein